ncbi:hypothetical protein ACFZDG_38135 [Kitasatospora xanthocidica]|uniref:hypothetical protein n=1 Tax=Kitasatospora xanthocidica TaxID=83382 RepID=UPI0036E2C5EB
MVSDGSWYVLIERDTRENDWVAGESTGYHRWELGKPLEAPKGREQALALAEEAARSHVPREGGRPEGKPARRVFRLAEGSWLVEVQYQHWTRHFRVSVAQLVHVEEEVPPPRPTTPPKDAVPPKRGLFGRR